MRIKGYICGGEISCAMTLFGHSLVWVCWCESGTTCSTTHTENLGPWNYRGVSPKQQVKLSCLAWRRLNRTGKCENALQIAGVRERFDEEDAPRSPSSVWSFRLQDEPGVLSVDDGRAVCRATQSKWPSTELLIHDKPGVLSVDVKKAANRSRQRTWS